MKSNTLFLIFFIVFTSCSSPGEKKLSEIINLTEGSLKMTIENLEKQKDEFNSEEFKQRYNDLMMGTFKGTRAEEDSIRNGGGKKLTIKSKINKYKDQKGIRFWGSCHMGNISGTAAITIKGKQVTVEYKAMGKSAIEKGSLTDIKSISNAGDSSYTLSGKWIKGSDFRMRLSNHTNNIYVKLYNNHWKYEGTSSPELLESYYKDIVKLLRIDVGVNVGVTVSDKVEGAKEIEEVYDNINDSFELPDSNTIDNPDELIIDLHENIAVMQANVNVRSDETINSEKIIMLNQFDEVEILSKGKEEIINGNRDYWYEIEVGADVKGYVFGHFTSLKEDGKTTKILTYQGCEMGDLFHLMFEGYDFGESNNNLMGYNLCLEDTINGEFTTNELYYNSNFELSINQLITRKYCNYPEDMNICIEKVPTIVGIKLLN